jgi:hypothetical protein
MNWHNALIDGTCAVRVRSSTLIDCPISQMTERPQHEIATDWRAVLQEGAVLTTGVSDGHIFC